MLNCQNKPFMLDFKKMDLLLYSADLISLCSVVAMIDGEYHISLPHIQHSALALYPGKDVLILIVTMENGIVSFPP